VKCDISLLQDIGRRIRTDIERIQNEIYALVGSNVNINSPKQIQVLLFEKLGIKPLKKNKTGYSVDNEVLEEIAKTHDIARMILEYRSLSKLESTYVTGLLRAVHPVTQKIHTTYDSLGALTGRMSSEAPNLQNIPTGDGYAREIKSCFIPQSSNHAFLVADYSQIELRILAFLSQDTHLLEAFVQDEDIHMRTARFLFPEKEIITSHERRIAKTVNFGVIYGITGFGLSKTLECPPWEATKYIESFYSLYPGVRKYYDDLLEQARQDGYVSTYFGRKRAITSLNDANKTIRSIAEREAMNMPIQGTAADILKYAMIDIAKNIQEKQLHGKMILQVHDELVFDIPLDEKEYFESLVRDSME
jgi:DNA polymerase-1